MFGISVGTIVFVVLTVALMGGFSSKKRGSGRRRYDEMYINDITSLAVSADEVRRFSEDRSPMTVEVNIVGKTISARRNRIASLNVGSVLYVAWSGRDSRRDGWVYSISFVDCLKNVYATARDEDKEELANRFDYITGAVVVEIDRDEPSLVVKVSFD